LSALSKVCSPRFCHPSWRLGEPNYLQKIAPLTSYLCRFDIMIDGEDKIESRQFEGRFAEDAFKAEFSNLHLVPLRLVQESPDGLMFSQICK